MKKCTRLSFHYWIVVTLAFMGIAPSSATPPTCQNTCAANFTPQILKLEDTLKKNETYKTKNNNLSDSILRKINSNITIIVLKLETLRTQAQNCCRTPKESGQSGNEEENT